MSASWTAGRPSRERAQRPQRHLDAGLRALVRDQGRGAVQSAEQGAELAGPLARVGVRHHRERLVEGEDQREVGRRQPPVTGRPHPPLPVAGVPGHVAAQRLRGHPTAVLVNKGLVNKGLVNKGLVNKGLVSHGGPSGLL